MPEDRAEWSITMLQTAHHEIPTRPLSDREVEVLEMKADGLTYEMIGQTMGIRARSAMQHAIHARDKLQAVTMFEAVVVAVKLGLVSKGEHDG